jgi:hypothetical protein
MIETLLYFQIQKRGGGSSVSTSLGWAGNKSLWQSRPNPE